MAARSQPVGLRGCRETMSAAGRQKTNITPPATSGGKGRRSSEVGRGTAAFLACSSQLRAASASEVPPIPQASQTAPRRRIVHLVLRALFRVASVPHERPGFVTKNVTGNESGFVQHPGTRQGAWCRSGLADGAGEAGDEQGGKRPGQQLQPQPAAVSTWPVVLAVVPQWRGTTRVQR